MEKNTENKLFERRRYIRLHIPVGISYASAASEGMRSATTKDISADGLRFEARDKAARENDIIELKLNLPNSANPVHAKGRILWKRKVSLEDRAPCEFGIEFTEIEEDNKNTFLKFLCDFIYKIQKEPGYVKV